MKKCKILLTLAMVLCLTLFGAAGCFSEGDKESSSSNTQSSSSMPETKLVVSETYFKLRVGEKVRLNAYTADGSAITYLSKASSVATVNENGEVTAVSSGIAFIVIKAGNETVTCKVEVYEVGYSIKLNKTEIFLVEGSSEKIIATVKRGGEICEETVEWSLDGTGMIESDGNTVTYTANGVGVATISAKIGKATAECAVKVMSATAVELPAPVFTEESNCAEVSWNAVEGAGKYQIKLNDGSWVETTETKYSFKDDVTANKYENGKLVDYQVSVRAIVAEDNYDYYNSAPTTITIKHDYEVTYTNPNATCIEPTAMAYICKVCGNGYEEGEYYKDHVYEDGACKICDKAQTAGLLYAYDETLNGYVMIGIDKDAYDGKTETVYVRGAYNDGTNGKKPVVAIGEAAFDAGTMTNVILPESVTSIGAVAFRDCTSLVEVKMTGVTQINENSCYAFIGCSALERLIVGAEFTLDSTTKEASVAQYFAGAYGIDGANGIFVPAEDSEDFVKATDSQGRYYGTYDKETDKLTVVDYGTDGAKILYNEYKIYTQIFPGANNVAILSVAEKEEATLTLNLGDGDASRVSGVYYYADEVVCGTDTWNYNEEGKTEIGNVHIFVDGECTRCGLKEMTGVVYAYDGATNTYAVTGLAEGYNPTDLVIPATFDNGLNGEANVVAIAANAFINNATLKTLTIGENVEVIGDSAFRFCTALESVTILGDIKTWGNVAFGNCTALTMVDLSHQTSNPIANDNGIFMDSTSITTIYANNDLKFGWSAFNVSSEFGGAKANVYVIGVKSAGETYFAEMLDANNSNALIGKIYYYDASKTVDGSWYYDENGNPTPLDETKYYATTAYWVNTYYGETTEVPDPEPEPIAYSYANGGYTVTGLNDTSLTDVVIPTTYDDGTNGEANVVGIASGAFADNSTVISVSITSATSSFTISGTAFNNCSALTTITINAPDFITMETNAIINCPALTTLICGNRFTLPDQGVLANLSVYPEAAKQIDVYVLTAYGTESQAINWNLTADGTTFGGNNMISNKAYFYSEEEVAGGWRYVDGIATPWNVDSYYTKNAAAWSFDAPTPLAVEPLIYTYANGGYTVTGLNDTSLTDVVIPTMYDDGTNGEANVVGIASGAFADNSTVISVSITSNTSAFTISGTAFNNCSALTTITINAPDFITMETNAIISCPALTTLICGNRFTLPDQGILANLAVYPEAAKQVDVYVLTAYGTESQAINWNLTEDGTTFGGNNMISNKAYFYSEEEVAGGWRYVDGVATPWNVDSYYMKNATAWSFDAPTPLAVEPLIYTYANGGYTVTGLNDTSLTNVVVPATYNDGTNGEANVVGIASGAFADNSTVISVSITSNTSAFTISGTAFNNCSALTTITINAPDFITMETNAIINCPALTTLICGNRFTLPDQGVLANLSVYPEAAKQVDVYVLTAYGTESQAINWNLTEDGTTFGGNNMLSNKAYFYSEEEVVGGWRYVDGVATPWNVDSYYTKNATAWSFDLPAA